jgi:hypothetical protein
MRGLKSYGRNVKVGRHSSDKAAPYLPRWRRRRLMPAAWAMYPDDGKMAAPRRDCYKFRRLVDPARSEAPLLCRSNMR